MANPIYAEVVPRELGYVLRDSLDVQLAWYVDEAGRLDMTKLLTAFGAFFGEHAEHWLERFSDYPEAGPQLILQAYLQRVVNGGGRIEREYGLGRGRTDLLVLWPREAGQPSDLWERFRGRVQGGCGTRGAWSGPSSGAWSQTLGYMAKCGADEGHLVVIDRRPERRRPGGAGRESAGRTRGDGLGAVVSVPFRVVRPVARRMNERRESVETAYEASIGDVKIDQVPGSEGGYSLPEQLTLRPPTAKCRFTNLRFCGDDHRSRVQERAAPPCLRAAPLEPGTCRAVRVRGTTPKVACCGTSRP